MAAIRFSIVVCTRDRRDSLMRCLESLREACRRLPPEHREHWELLVVDNGSTDGTAAAVESLAEKYPVVMRCVPEPRAGIAYARNQALRSARGEVLAICDDDVTVVPGWAQAWADVFEDPGVVAAAAPIQPVFPAQTEAWFARGVLLEGSGPTAFYDAGTETLVRGPRVRFNLPYTANAAVRRAAALEVGGFREDLGYLGQSAASRVCGEDKEFFRRLEKTGGKIVYTPHARVSHHLSPDHVTMEYYCLWHRGYGISMERMRPGHSAARNFFKLLEQGFQYCFYSLQLWFPGQQRNFRAHRKQSQARGRLDQILAR